MTGLKVIDGTPTAISKYLRERENINDYEDNLDRTLKELGWVQIKQGIYKLLKINDPKNFHNYTCRIRHKYYKFKNKVEDIEVYLDLTKSKFKKDLTKDLQLKEQEKEIY